MTSMEQDRTAADTPGCPSWCTAHMGPEDGWEIDSVHGSASRNHDRWPWVITQGESRDPLGNPRPIEGIEPAGGLYVDVSDPYWWVETSEGHLRGRRRPAPLRDLLKAEEGQR